MRELTSVISIRANTLDTPDLVILDNAGGLRRLCQKCAAEIADLSVELRVEPLEARGKIIVITPI